MELKKSLQENSGSSINLQADKIIVNNTWVEAKGKKVIVENFDESKEQERKSCIRVSLDIDYDKFGIKEENCLKWALAKFLDIPIDDISIKMIEKGSTEVVIELPEKQAEKILLANKETINNFLEIINIINIRKEDMWHDTKRSLSFDIFDTFLNRCHSRNCPCISISHTYYLSDISIDSYIKDRAYFYSIDSIGIDANDRFFMAERKKSIFFNCCVNPTLSKEIFEQEQRQIEDNYYHSSIKRKAYWSYLSGKYENKDKDYIQSEYFVNKIKEIYKKITEERNADSLFELKELLANNSNIASALDMYRYCFLRQCLNEKNEM